VLLSFNSSLLSVFFWTQSVQDRPEHFVVVGSSSFPCCYCLLLWENPFDPQEEDFVPSQLLLLPPGWKGFWLYSSSSCWQLHPSSSSAAACCLIKIGDNRPAAGSESKSPLDVELLFTSSSSYSSAENSLVGAGWSVSSTWVEFTRLLWGKLLWSLVVLGSKSLELLTSSWHSGEEGIIECRRKLSVHVLLLLLHTVLRASTPSVMNDVFPALATKVCITEDALVLHGLVNSYGLKPAKEEEQQQQSIWNTATTLVMWSLSVSHTSSVGERDISPRTAAAVHCTANKPPKVFPPPSSNHESKFRDQVSCFLQIFRPSFLLSANFQIKIVFFLQKSSKARFSVFCKFLEQVFFLVFCKLFPEQVVFIFSLKFFSRASSFCCLQIISRAIFLIFFLQPSSSKDHHVQWQLTRVSSTSTSNNIL